MKENVLINIRGTQFDGEQEETIETLYSGKYRHVGSSDVFMYEEIIMDDNPNDQKKAKNILKVTENQITLSKKGIVETEMIFNTNKSHHGYYATPFGMFNMDIHTKKLQINHDSSEKEDSLSLSIQYSLSLNGQEVSKCRLEMKITG